MKQHLRLCRTQIGPGPVLIGEEVKEKLASFGKNNFMSLTPTHARKDGFPKACIGVILA